MPAGNQTRLPRQIHFDIKDHVAVNLFVELGRFVAVNELECRHNILHFLLDRLSPKVGPRSFIDLKGLCHRLRQFDSKLMRLSPVSGLDLLYDSIPFAQSLAYPPSKCRFFSNLVGDSILRDLHRV